MWRTQLALRSLFQWPWHGNLAAPNRYIEMCSTRLVIREMKIKTTLRDHLTPVNVAITKKTKDSGADEDVEKREPF